MAILYTSLQKPKTPYYASAKCSPSLKHSKYHHSQPIRENHMRRFERNHHDSTSVTTKPLKFRHTHTYLHLRPWENSSNSFTASPSCYRYWPLIPLTSDYKFSRMRLTCKRNQRWLKFWRVRKKHKQKQIEAKASLIARRWPSPLFIQRGWRSSPLNCTLKLVGTGK